MTDALTQKIKSACQKALNHLYLCNDENHACKGLKEEAQKELREVLAELEKKG